MPGSEHCSQMDTPPLRTGNRTLGNLHMPAMWPLDLSRAVADWIRARRRRRVFLRLLKLDDNLLRDLGYTREDILWGVALPLRENAAQAVTERSRARATAAGRSRRRRDGTAAVRRTVMDLHRDTR